MKHSCRTRLSTIFGTALLAACAPVGEAAETPLQQALPVSTPTLPIVRSPSGGGRYLTMRADPAGQRFYAGTDISGLMRATMPAASTLATSDPETWVWTNYAVPGTTSIGGLYSGIATAEIHDIATIAGTDTVFAATPDGLYRRQSPTAAWSLVLQPTRIGRNDADLESWTRGAVRSWKSACGGSVTLPWCDTARREASTGDYPSSIQAVAVSPATSTTPTVVWAGVGRRISIAVGQSTNYSPYTLFRSLDAGTTWEPVLALHIDYTTSDNYRIGPTVNAIEVDPLDPRVVYVATDMGLYRTTNGLVPATLVTWSELGRNREVRVMSGTFDGLTSSPVYPRTWAFPVRSGSATIACTTPSATAGDTGLCLPNYGDELHPNVRDVAISRSAAGAFVHALIESNHVAACAPGSRIDNAIFASNVFTSAAPASAGLGTTWTRRIVHPTPSAPQPPSHVACDPGSGDVRDEAIAALSTHYTSLQARGNDIAVSVYNGTAGGVVMNVGGTWQDMGPTKTTRHESEAQMGLWGDPARGDFAIWETPMAWDHWVQRWDDLVTAPRRALFSSDREVQSQFSSYSGATRTPTVGHTQQNLDETLSLSELGSSYVYYTDGVDARGRDGLFWRSSGASNIQVQTPLVFFDGRYFVGTRDAGLLVTPNAGASWARAQIIQEYLLGVPAASGGLWRRTGLVGGLVKDTRAATQRLFSVMYRTDSTDGEVPRPVIAWLEAGPGVPTGAGARYRWKSRVFSECGTTTSDIRQIALDPRGAGRVVLATSCGLYAFDTSVGDSPDFTPTSSVFTRIGSFEDGTAITNNISLLVADPSVDATGVYFKTYTTIDGQHRIYRLDTTTMASRLVRQTGYEPHAFTIVRHPLVADGVRVVIGVQLSSADPAISEPAIALNENNDPRNPANPWLTPALVTSIAAPPSPTGSPSVNGRPIMSYWRPTAFAVDPADARHVLLGFGYDINYGGTWPTAVYESFNSGETWRAASAYDTLRSKLVSAISFVDGRVYFSTAAGLVGF